jgi:Ca-activated chloride channel family protein
MITVNYDFEPSVLIPSSSSTVDLLLSFRSSLPQSPRRDLNLSLVVDRSGSMAGSPLYYALKAAESVVNELEVTDSLSIVVYDDNIDTVIPPQPVANKNELNQRIRNVNAGGLTNLAGGWLKGCEYVKSQLDPHKINRVLLLTDGHANVGVCDPHVLTATAQNKAEEGVITTTLGFAQGFNEDLLINMARAAKGNFYFIQSIDEATEVFKIELDSLRAVVGQNLQVTLELAEGVTLVDTLSLAQQETLENGQISLTLGEIYEREAKLLGLRLQLSDLALGNIPIMRLHYRADVIQDGMIREVTVTTEIIAKVGTVEESALSSSSETLLQLSRLKIAKAKENALNLAEQGKHEEGEQILRTLIQELCDRGLNENFEIAEEIDQLSYFADRIAKKALGNEGRKELLDQTYQTLNRNRSDLVGRGVTVGEEIFSISVVNDIGEGVELMCVREGGKLRIKVLSEGYDTDKNVQFPRAIRAEGAHYIVESLELSKDGSFYRVSGNINRFAKPGEPDIFITHTVRRSTPSSSKPSKAPPSAADLPTTDTVGVGILVQCVKEKSKLRARVVSDGYEANWNMRFPRSIREEGMLYVVDEVKTGPDGKSYIACGNIKRLIQPK